MSPFYVESDRRLILSCLLTFSFSQRAQTTGKYSTSLPLFRGDCPQPLPAFRFLVRHLVRKIRVTRVHGMHSTPNPLLIILDRVPDYLSRLFVSYCLLFLKLIRKGSYRVPIPRCIYEELRLDKKLLPEKLVNLPFVLSAV